MKSIFNYSVERVKDLFTLSKVNKVSTEGEKLANIDDQNLIDELRKIKKNDNIKEKKRSILLRRVYDRYLDEGFELSNYLMNKCFNDIDITPIVINNCLKEHFPDIDETLAVQYKIDYNMLKDIKKYEDIEGVINKLKPVKFRFTKILIIVIICFILLVILPISIILLAVYLVGAIIAFVKTLNDKQIKEEKSWFQRLKLILKKVFLYNWFYAI